MKNESLGEPAYISLSTNQQQGLETSGAIYQGTDPAGFPAAGKTAKLKSVVHSFFSCSFLALVGQMDFSQVCGPLMTPPISPAALVHRGSVINQGPLSGRPLASLSATCPASSSSSTTSSSSSSSCLPSLSPMTQHSPCASFPETLYHCLPQTSSGYFQTSSGSSSSYQPGLRSGGASDSFKAGFGFALVLPDGPPLKAQTSESRRGFHLCLRPQTPSQCLVPVQPQAPSLAYHLSRYPSFNEQHATRDAFYSHPHPAGPYSSFGTKSSLAPYGPPARPASSYSSGSDPLPSEQGLGAQAAQILDSAEGFVFMGAGLNGAGAGCQAHPYAAAGHSGNSLCLLLGTFCCLSVSLWCFELPDATNNIPPF